MAHILLTWEMGLNLGHLKPLSWLAEAFEQRGHRVSFAVRDADRARQLLPEATVFQTPLPKPLPNPKPSLLNYTDILHRHGYDTPGELPSALTAWLQLFNDQKPDLIVADHAPTALLAARCAGLPKVPFGIGFLIPPRQSPMPLCQWWQPSPPRAELRQLERDVLASINRALQANEATPLERVADLLDSPVRALATIPELDDYPERPGNERYFGLQANPGGGTWPGWPAGNGPKVLGYLQAGYPAFKPLMAALKTLPVRALIYVPGLTTEQHQAHSAPHVTLTSEPLDIRIGAEECDCALSYASIGFVADLLAAGKPLLLAPPFIQHAMIAQRVLQQGAGVPVEPYWDQTRCHAALTELIDSAQLRRNAEQLAKAIQRYPRGQAVDEAVVKAAEGLL